MGGCLLPSASEGWGTHCFHRCVSVNKLRRIHQTTDPWSFPGGGEWVGAYSFWSQALSKKRGYSVLIWAGGWDQDRGSPPPPSSRAHHGQDTACLSFSRRRTFLLLLSLSPSPKLLLIFKFTSIVKKKISLTTSDSL